MALKVQTITALSATTAGASFWSEYIDFNAAVNECWAVVQGFQLQYYNADNKVKSLEVGVIDTNIDGSKVKVKYNLCICDDDDHYVGKDTEDYSDMTIVVIADVQE